MRFRCHFNFLLRSTRPNMKKIYGSLTLRPSLLMSMLAMQQSYKLEVPRFTVSRNLPTSVQKKWRKGTWTTSSQPNLLRRRHRPRQSPTQAIVLLSIGQVFTPLPFVIRGTAALVGPSPLLNNWNLMRSARAFWQRRRTCPSSRSCRAMCMTGVAKEVIPKPPTCTSRSQVDWSRTVTILTHHTGQLQVPVRLRS